MALGRQLVEELQLEPSVDTLGRWMAHHVAALISLAEAARTAQERKAAAHEAVEVILRIWSHRSNAERVNPLADLKSALGILQAVAQDPPPWRFSDAEDSRTARQTYDLLRRLTICLCLLEMGGTEPLRRGLVRAQRTAMHQNRHERAVAVFLASWLSTMPELPLAKGRPRRTEGRAKKARGKADLRELGDLRKIALSIAEKAKASLGELAERLSKAGLQPASMGLGSLPSVTPVLPRPRRTRKARPVSI